MYIRWRKGGVIMLKLKNFLYEKREEYQKKLIDNISNDEFSTDEVSHVREILNLLNDIIVICIKRNKF